MASTCASLKLLSNEVPRWPDVPKDTRCAGTEGSGRKLKYAATSFATSTNCGPFAGCPASGLICVLTASLSQVAIAPDQRIGRAVVREHGLAAARNFCRSALGQRLAELHAPLIEGVDVPDRALHEHAVLVERDQRAERARREPLGKDGVAGTVAFESAMWNQVVGCSLGLHFLGGLSERQRLALCKQIGHQQVVLIAEGIERLAEADEIAGDEPRSLMDQLEKRMLSVGAGLAPVDRPGLVIHAFAVEGNVLAIALHRELLQIGWESLEILVVRQHGDGRSLQKIVIPDR